MGRLLGAVFGLVNPRHWSYTAPPHRAGLDVSPSAWPAQAKCQAMRNRRNAGSAVRPNRIWMLEEFGVIAQLGERFNGIEEVVGSIPSGSTTQSPHFIATSAVS
jgi:hypothetical protein